MINNTKHGGKANASRQTINGIENNKYDPTLSLAFKLSKILGTAIDDLYILNLY